MSDNQEPNDSMNQDSPLDQEDHELLEPEPEPEELNEHQLFQIIQEASANLQSRFTPNYETDMQPSVQEIAQTLGEYGTLLGLGGLRGQHLGFIPQGAIDGGPVAPWNPFSPLDQPALPRMNETAAALKAWITAREQALSKKITTERKKTERSAQGEIGAKTMGLGATAFATGTSPFAAGTGTVTATGAGKLEPPSYYQPSDARRKELAARARDAISRIQSRQTGEQTNQGKKRLKKWT
jgi:hypothetical protein